MVEYINKEVPLERLDIENALGGHYGISLAEINKIHAADVRPVVRGRWIFEKGDRQTCCNGWVCSACNCCFHTNVPYFEDFNFCPNCGADMRHEEGEAE